MTQTVIWPTAGQKELPTGGLNYWPCLPTQAPACLRELNVTVTDPDRILWFARGQRTRAFQVLVKRYVQRSVNILLKLRFGCEHPSCRTPTCFTFKSRVSPAPLRRLTSVSARTMACYMVALGSAESALCPYLTFTRFLSFSGFEMDEASSIVQHLTEGRQNVTEAEWNKHERPTQTQPVSQPSSDPQRPESSEHHPKSTTDSKEKGLKPLLEEKPAKRDQKSFTQNLFSTSALEKLEKSERMYMPRSGYNKSVPTPQGEPQSDRAGSRIQPAPKSSRQSYGSPDPESTLQDNATSADPSVTERRQVPITSVRWSQPPPNVAVNARAETRDRSQTIKKSYSMTLPTGHPQAVVHAALKRRRCSSAPIPARCPLPSIEQSQISPLGVSTTTLTGKPCPKGSQNQKSIGLPTSQTAGSSKASRIPKHASSSSTDEDPTSTPLARDRPSQNSSHETTKIQPDRHKLGGLVFAQKPQSLSHFTYQAVDALINLLTWFDGARGVSFDERRLRHYFERSLHSLAHPRHQMVLAYLEQCIHYILADPDTLLKSFKDASTCPTRHKIPSLKILLVPHLADRAFRLLIEEKPALVFESLGQSVEILYTPPPDLVPRRSSRSKPSMSSSSRRKDQPHKGTASNPVGVQHRFLTDAEACHIVLLGFHALVAAVPKSITLVGTALRNIRAAGEGVDRPIGSDFTRPIADLMRCNDVFEDEMCLRFACRLLRSLATRLYFLSILKERVGKGGRGTPPQEEQQGMMEMICTYLRLSHSTSHPKGSEWDWGSESSTRGDPPHSAWSMSAVVVEWIRTVLVKNWDGKEEVGRFGVVGSAVTVLKGLYEKREWLGLAPESFYTPYIYRRLDPIDVTAGWLSTAHGSKTIHLLMNPFLFSPHALVTYFRALNFQVMSRAFEAAILTVRQAINLAILDQEEDDRNLMVRLQIAVSNYLVIEVRREYLLMDTFNQLWRRERRELFRPLKVRIGMDQGEEGVDHGGVQQEYFRLVMGEALNPDYGIFKTDPETHMSWIQPLSPEPLYKFELLGLLMGLAIYNGANVPVTFPRAFYRKLLGLEVNEISHIRDGWPALSKGLTDLLTWDDGDVKDVFVRTYEFSFDLWDTRIDVDLETIGRDEDWPRKETMRKDKGKQKAQPESNKRKFREKAVLSQKRSINSDPHDATNSSNTAGLEAGLVTNDNREQYVKDYIFWLTDKSIRPQFEAFSRGFFTMINKRALSIFPPEILQTVAQGVHEIDSKALEKSVRYDDGYSSDHPLIRKFWAVVHSFSPFKKRRLLEFVTSSERVPVSGYQSITFVIHRSGPDSDRLPTSQTCFGRLLLPEYSSKRKLKQKLRLALEHSKGFGVP
ncbi:MAG: hypothetical protein M1816_004477 [Peltula sp. TS41687]|nr:MAG: hypothetical protein M1816_004477 [Peltula sp. TS41687]